MSDGKLHLDLEPFIDKHGKKAYVAKLKGPFVIDCSEKTGGVAFLIFVSTPGEEEIQISHITEPKKDYRK
jgi:hypothetical protein